MGAAIARKIVLMSDSAYVLGDLTWPMPDLGLVAVWRAMPIDATRWDDWDGFVESLRDGTVATLIDNVAGKAAPCTLDLDENGVKLRAVVTDEVAWQRLAIAWRAAADLGASGELVWCKSPAGVAYRATVRDYDSQWEKLAAAPPSAELAALVAAAQGVVQPIEDRKATKSKPVKKPAAKKPAAAPARKKSATKKK